MECSFRVVTLSDPSFLVCKQDINIISLCVLRLCLAANSRGQMAAAQSNRSLFCHGTSSLEVGNPGLMPLFKGLTEDPGSFCMQGHNWLSQLQAKTRSQQHLPRFEELSKEPRSAIPSYTSSATARPGDQLYLQRKLGYQVF